MAGKPDYAPVYLIWGADAFSREEAVKALLDRVVDPAWKAFNLTSLGPEATLGDACAAVQTPPFGSGGRAVLVPNSSLFGGRKAADDEGDAPERKAGDGDAGALESLVRHNWIPGNCLIFTAEAVDRRRKIVKTLEALGEVKEYGAIKPWEAERVLVPWLDEQARRAGSRLSRDAAELLCQTVGTDRQRLNAELQKLITYAGPGTPVQAEHVRAVVSGEEADLFAWLELLARQDYEEALAQLRRLLLTEPPLKFVAALGTTFLRLYRMKLLAETGQPAPAIAAAVGTPPGLVGKTLRQWQAYPAPVIFRHLESLLALETTLKTRGGQRPDQVGQLEVWLARWKLGRKKKAAGS